MTRRTKSKSLNLALQGGGSHGAFTWGVLDRLLEDGRIRFDGLSCTSAGAMNGVVCAYGFMQGGADGARSALAQFWKAISNAGQGWNPLRGTAFDAAWGGALANASFAVWDAWTRLLSPYQLNPLNINPLREVLLACVDFDVLRECDCMQLFVCATNVGTGKPRIFRNRELSVEAVLASGCLPQLFQAVEVEGEHYWDGGFIGNPAIYPLIYECKALDVLIVHVNPLVDRRVPRTAAEIMDRMNEVTFNSSLVREMRAIAFVQKLVSDGWIKDEYKRALKSMRMHAIRADQDLVHLGLESKMDADWHFLCNLRDLGRARASEWLAGNYDLLGVRSSIDIRAEYL